MENLCIGLFGTCGQSKWRLPFIDMYEREGIKYFNPQWPEGTWHPGCIPIENEHLMTDALVLFPVTSETTGQGSLAEIGFSINAALHRNPDRYFIFLIDDECTAINVTPSEIKDSNRSRALVKSKLCDIAKINSGIYVMNDLDSMLKLSLELYNVLLHFNNINKVYSNG